MIDHNVRTAFNLTTENHWDSQAVNWKNTADTQWVQNVIKSPTVDVRIGDRHYTGTARVLHRAKDADAYIAAQEDRKSTRLNSSH